VRWTMVILLVSLQGGAALAADDEQQPGKSEFMQYCASCHGESGTGDGPLAASLEIPPSDLTRLSEKYGTPLPKEKIGTFIDGTRLTRAHGPREMPVWGKKLYSGLSGPSRSTLVRGSIYALVDYLDTIQRPER